MVVKCLCGLAAASSQPLVLSLHSVPCTPARPHLLLFQAALCTLLLGSHCLYGPHPLHFSYYSLILLDSAHQEDPPFFFSCFLNKYWLTRCQAFCSDVPPSMGFSRQEYWKIPWMEEPGRLQSMGSLRVGHDWATSLSFFTFMHWRRKWQPTPVFLPGESQGWGSLVGCSLWDHTESDRTEVT